MARAGASGDMSKGANPNAGGFHPISALGSALGWGNAEQGAADAAKKASGQYADLGKTLYGQQMQGLGQANSQYAAPQAQWDKTYGQNAPSNLETLYQQRQSGVDPYYDRVMQQSLGALNQQMSARGGFNSSAALMGSGNMIAGIDAQRFHDQSSLAEAADRAQQQRYQNAFTGQYNISNAQAQNTLGAYGKASAFYGDQANQGIGANYAAGIYQSQADQARNPMTHLVGAAKGAIAGGLSGGMPGAIAGGVGGFIGDPGIGAAYGGLQQGEQGGLGYYGNQQQSQSQANNWNQYGVNPYQGQ